MSTEGESRRVPDLLKRRSSRRQALKGVAALGFGTPLPRFASASAQSPVTITWFAWYNNGPGHFYRKIFSTAPVSNRR